MSRLSWIASATVAALFLAGCGNPVATPAAPSEDSSAPVTPPAPAPVLSPDAAPSPVTDAGPATDADAAPPEPDASTDAPPPPPSADAEVDAGPLTGEVFPIVNGWTSLAPSSDSLQIYVSSSAGSDANDGSSPAMAVKSIAHASSLMRDGYPDWMLLARGDVWTGEFFDNFVRSGRSQAEPMVITTYGSGAARPQLKTGGGSGFTAYNLESAHGPVHDLAIMGIEFYADTRDPASPTFVAWQHPYADGGAPPPPGSEGMSWSRPGYDLLIEDCAFRFYVQGITILGNVNASGPPTTLNNVAIRRTLVTDSYTFEGKLGHAEGIYAEYVDGLLLEDDILDHNGWSETVPAAGANIFDHNSYIQVTTTNLAVRGTMFLRGGSYGLEAKAGGTVNIDDSLFVGNAQAMEYGQSENIHPSALGATGRIRGNVVMESRDIDPSDQAGQGFEIGNVPAAGLLIDSNIVADNASAGPYGHAFLLNADDAYSLGLANITMTNNVTYNWILGLAISNTTQAFHGLTLSSNVFAQAAAVVGNAPPLVAVTGAFPTGASYSSNAYSSSEPAADWFGVSPASTVAPTLHPLAWWVTTSGETGATGAATAFADPSRTIASYEATLGGASTNDAFYAAVRGQSHSTWSSALATPAVLAYIQAGFAH